LNAVKKGSKYINITHPDKKNIKSEIYKGDYPEYINLDKMINELNTINK
jgi:hypothetical protein